jgi:hypothetical protein
VLLEARRTAASKREAAQAALLAQAREAGELPVASAKPDPARLLSQTAAARARAEATAAAAEAGPGGSGFVLHLAGQRTRPGWLAPLRGATY